MNVNNPNNKNFHDYAMLFLKIILMNFLLGNKIPHLYIHFLKQYNVSTIFIDFITLLTISNHQQNQSIFAFTIIFWFVWEIYCFFIVWYKQDIKSNCLIISLKLFPIFYSILSDFRSDFKSEIRFRACFEHRVPWHSGNYRVWIHSEMRTWHDKNIQSNAPYR